MAASALRVTGSPPPQGRPLIFGLRVRRRRKGGLRVSGSGFTAAAQWGGGSAAYTSSSAADGCAGFAFGGSANDESWTALCLDGRTGQLHYEGYTLDSIDTMDPMAVTRFNFERNSTHHLTLVCENEIVILYIDGEKALSSRIGHSTNGAHIGVFADEKGATFSNISMSVPE